jgi:anti-anti-sigma factor
VLAAIIIDAVVFGMMNVKEMRRLRRVARADFWIAIAAILGVLSAGVLSGVMIGIALSVVWLIYVSAAPYMPELGRQPETQVFRSLDEFPDSETYPGLLVMGFDAGLFFASVDALEDRLRELALRADPPLHTVVLDFEGINFIDSQGSGKLAEIHELVTNYDIELRLTRVKPHVKDLLQRDGFIDRLGEGRVYGNVYEAAADQIPDTSTSVEQR